MDVRVGDILEMKKQHPCGTKQFFEDVSVLKSDTSHNIFIIVLLYIINAKFARLNGVFLKYFTHKIKKAVSSSPSHCKRKTTQTIRP